MTDFKGSRVLEIGPVTIGAITPEARDLLDTIMEQWEEHNKGSTREPSIYGFAYWLVRYSGLIQPAQKEHKDD